MVITALSSADKFNGAPVSVGQHEAFVWTISKVHCTGATCTASMVSGGGLHYALIWDGSRWTAKSEVGHAACGPNDSQTNDYVATVTFRPTTTSSRPKTFVGKFEEVLTGACLPGGGHVSATLTMRRA